MYRLVKMENPVKKFIPKSLEDLIRIYNSAHPYKSFVICEFENTDIINQFYDYLVERNIGVSGFFLVSFKSNIYYIELQDILPFNSVFIWRKDSTYSEIFFQINRYNISDEIEIDIGTIVDYVFKGNVLYKIVRVKEGIK